MNKKFMMSVFGRTLAIALAFAALAGTVQVANAQVLLTDSTTTTVDIPMYNLAQSGAFYKVGSNDSGVLTLERFLQNRGYLSSTIVADTMFDANTKQALASYQVQAHLVGDGIMGSHTRAHMAVVLWFKIHGFTTRSN